MNALKRLKAGRYGRFGCCYRVTTSKALLAPESYRVSPGTVKRHFSTGDHPVTIQRAAPLLIEYLPLPLPQTVTDQVEGLREDLDRNS